MNPDSASSIRYKSAWMVFFVAFVCLLLYGLVSFVAETDDLAYALPQIAFFLALSGFFLIPLHGYVWGVDHGGQRFYRYVSWFLLIHFLSMVVFSVAEVIFDKTNLVHITYESDLPWPLFVFGYVLWVYSVWCYSRPERDD